MKKMIFAFVGIFAFALSANAQKKSGAIQFETTLDPAAMAAERGIQLSEQMKANMPKSVKTNFELLFTATNASYMLVEETEDSNGGGGGGGMGRMMMRFGGSGGAREYFYNFAEQKLVEVFDLSDTTYAMQSKLTLASPVQPNFNMGGGNRQGGANANTSAPAATANSIEYIPGEARFEVVKSDETKKIIGLNCNKAIVKTIRKAKVLGEVGEISDETTVWYTTELGFNFSPNPNMWTEGTVLAIETKGSLITAKSIEYRGVSSKDVTAPKKALAITPDEYKLKMENMMKRFSGGGNRQGGTPARMSIN